jgi:HK97 family phage prohead protease
MEIKKLEYGVEVKDFNDAGQFTAYASTFGNADQVNDVIEKGAFTETLSTKAISDVFMFWQHDSDQIIGEWIEIKEDDHGLLVKGQLYVDDIQQAKETHFLMKKGKIKQLSIGFNIIKKAFEGGKRILKEINLSEISPVTFPCNLKAEILGVKSSKDLTIREFEEKLRDVGLSQKEAKAVCANGYKGLTERDAQETEQELKEAQLWAEILTKTKEITK